MDFKSETIKVPDRGTHRAFDSLIVISVGKLEAYSDDAMVTVGSVGRNNKRSKIVVGDFVYYECGEKGAYEIRLTGRDTDAAFFLISRIDAPFLWENVSRIQEGIVLEAGAVRTNDPISDKEARTLKEKLNQLEIELTKEFAPTQEQISFIHENYNIWLMLLDARELWIGCIPQSGYLYRLHWP